MPRSYQPRSRTTAHQRRRHRRKRTTDDLQLDQCVFHREPAQEPVYGAPITETLPPTIADILAARGIERLYRYQEAALERAAAHNIVLTAPTAAGKTEVYLIPLVREALTGRRSLVIYPTKALARDQLERFAAFAPIGVRAAVYDGDTPRTEREKIRAALPPILITNPDMLHYLLMNSRLFDTLWSTLDRVVIDEVHTYSGVFGSHVANVLRRLRRICARAGTDPRFICCSATIANPRAFCEMLVGAPFEHIAATDAPRGEIVHVIVNPPPVGPSEEYRQSYVKTAVQLLKRLHSSYPDAKMLVFGNSHSAVERLGIMARDWGLDGIEVYRGGLTQRRRKAIERAFKRDGSGNARDVNTLVTTSALELGMDIPSVDLVVLAGFPGSITRVKQRVGRAGRQGQSAEAYLVARSNPLDQYYADHIDAYIGGEVESAFVNPDNPDILHWHLLALMRDTPATEAEIRAFSPAAVRSFHRLLMAGLVRDTEHGWQLTNAGTARIFELNLRGSGRTFDIVDQSGRVIGTRAEYMAYAELFPGAVYLHGGRKYHVRDLDVNRGRALVRALPDQITDYTTAQTEKHAQILAVEDARTVFRSQTDLHYGRIHMTTIVTGYYMRDYLTGRNYGVTPLDEPLAYEFDTQAFWLDYPRAIVEGVSRFPEGLHAAEHVGIAMMPALTGASATEIGGLSLPSGRMYVYDGVPGGAGLTRIGFERFELIQKMALDRLRSCPCAAGCPSCVFDPLCGNNNQHLDKEAGREILDAFVGS